MFLPNDHNHARQKLAGCLLLLNPNPLNPEPIRAKTQLGTHTVALVICCEFGHGDDANTWRKSTKEADKD